LQALLDINSAQTANKLAEQLVSSKLRSKSFPYAYIRWERFRRKTDGFRMNCPKTTKIDSVTLHLLCFQNSGKKISFTKSLQAMKNGFFMITLNIENHELTLVNLQHGRQSPIFTPRRFCSMSGGIGKVCCITELLQPNETIMTDRYQQQLTNLNDALEVKRPFTGQGRRKVILFHDNAPPHVAKATQDHIFALGRELFLHAAYNPDMAPFDYYLFRSLEHHLADTHFVRFEEMRNCINDFIASKPVNFYRQGIRKLPERWQRIHVDANGDYFADSYFSVCCLIKEFYRKKHRIFCALNK